MKNLYGIETQDDCRRKIDELLEMTQQAQQTMNKEEISALKSRLETYYEEGNTEKGQDQMSWVESSFFWPAIREAYINAPKLNSPKRWGTCLYEIGSSLRYYGPQEHIE